MGLYEVPLSMSLFWVVDYVIQFPYVWYYVGVKSSFNMLVRNPIGPICLRALMICLSGPCELLF